MTELKITFLIAIAVVHTITILLILRHLRYTEKRIVFQQGSISRLQHHIHMMRTEEKTMDKVNKIYRG